MNVGYTATVLWVLKKDLQTELRSKQTLAMMGLFSVVMTLVFAFGFASDPQTNAKVFPGVLWANVLFVGTLGMGRTFAREQLDGAFTALILSPAERSAILLAKMITNLIIVLGVLLIVIPLLALMLQVDLTEHIGLLAVQIVLGAFGFAVVGTPLAVMATNARFAEVLLPMVVFPLVSPVLIAGVAGTGALLGTTIESDPYPWLKLNLAFDTLYAVGGLYLFERMVIE